MVSDTGSWLQFIMVLVGVGALVLLSLRQASSVRRMMEPLGEPKYYTVERCGDREFTRKFEPGDYVGKVTGECEGGVKIVVAIYSEDIQQPKGKRGPLF